MPLKAYNGTLHPPKDYDPLNDYLYKGLNEYRTILYFKESGNNPLAFGLFYYKGKGQIGRQAALDVNVHYDSLHIESWNDTATVRLMRKNWEYLKDYHNCVGCTLRGIKITKAGMLAGAHLRGHAAVAKWIRSDGDSVLVDGNGVKVTEYIRMMENVNLIKY